MKKENTVNKKLKNPVNLVGRTVTDIWFDLKHIQHGWDTVTKDYAAVPARNNYTEDDIVTLFEQLNVLSQTLRSKRLQEEILIKGMFFIFTMKGKS